MRCIAAPVRNHQGEVVAAISVAGPTERMPRTLVGSDSPFGQTEFAVRDILLRVGAKVYEQHLAQKKTATKAPA